MHLDNRWHHSLSAVCLLIVSIFKTACEPGNHGLHMRLYLCSKRTWCTIWMTNIFASSCAANRLAIVLDTHQSQKYLSPNSPTPARTAQSLLTSHRQAKPHQTSSLTRYNLEILRNSFINLCCNNFQSGILTTNLVHTLRSSNQTQEQDLAFLHSFGKQHLHNHQCQCQPESWLNGAENGLSFCYDCFDRTKLQRSKAGISR